LVCVLSQNKYSLKPLPRKRYREISLLIVYKCRAYVNNRLIFSMFHAGFGGE
jgi:hypothetical protein